jgi:UDP-N-acetylglucosamine transferase subunit ALG13
MIFVTVGTHEQQFNRLIQYIDELKTDEEVFMQTGYSTYLPEHCRYKEMIGYKEMLYYFRKADIIITHGGPGSIILAMQQKKIPIVVPRQQKFGEHINDHQVDFAKRLERENKIIPVYDISNLGRCICQYKEICARKSVENYSNNESFNKEFQKLVDHLFVN